MLLRYADRIPYFNFVIQSKLNPYIMLIFTIIQIILMVNLFKKRGWINQPLFQSMYYIYCNNARTP